MTLVSEIEYIQNLPEKAGADKKELIKNTIESYRKNYPLLEEVIQGRETTFEKTYQPLHEKHGLIRAVFPKWIKKHEVKITKENEELVDVRELEGNGKSVFSTVWGSAFLGLATYLEILTFFPEWVDAMPTTGIYDSILGVMGGVMFACVGIAPRLMMLKDKSLLKHGLKTLDEQIEATYHQK